MYNLFTVNSDGSKNLAASFPDLVSAQAAIAAMDPAQIYSIELWDDGGATVIQ